MTTLRDLLRDFKTDVLQLKANNTNEDNCIEDTESLDAELDILVDEYLETICERWVGQQ